MPTITLRENQATESGFAATLSFDHRLDFPVTIRDPFSLAEEQRLEWYLEEWLRFPLIDRL